MILFPSGEFITYCTLAELKVIEKQHYKILDSYQFVSDHKEYPFADFIQKMYSKRCILKKEKNPLQLPLKTILNSIYGKTGESYRGKIGSLFNPVIFASITGIARAQLYQFVRENNLEKEIVSFATDSICVTSPLDIDSDVLGEFSFENQADDVYYLQNGFYRFNKIWKQRGLGSLGAKQIEHIKTIERDGRLFYKFKVLRNSKLRSSIIQNKISDIGKIRPVEREINLNADRKRLWLGQLSSINERIMNESVPISLNHFSKDQI